MKNRIFPLILSLALLFFFAGASSLAQNKPEKKDNKTEKQVEQKVVPQDAKANVNKSNEKNKKTSTMTMNNKISMPMTQHHKMQGTTVNDKQKLEKASVKDEANKKVR